MAVDISGSYDPFGDSSGIALWQFEQTMDDVSGNYNGDTDGVYVTGKVGDYALDCTSMTANSNVGTIDIGQNFSCSAWFYTLDSDGTYGSVFVGDHFEAFWSTNSGSHDFGFRYKVSNGAWVTMTIQTADPNTWYHVAATGDDVGGKVYVNGEYLRKQDYPKAASSESYYFTSGHVYLDQFRLFNRTLTEEEIKALYYDKIYYHYLKTGLIPYHVLRTWRQAGVDVEYRIREMKWLMSKVEAEYGLRRSKTSSRTIPYALGEQTIVTRIERR